MHSVAIWALKGVSRLVQRLCMTNMGWYLSTEAGRGLPCQCSPADGVSEQSNNRVLIPPATPVGCLRPQFQYHRLLSAVVQYHCSLSRLEPLEQYTVRFHAIITSIHMLSRLGRCVR